MKHKINAGHTWILHSINTVNSWDHGFTTGFDQKLNIVWKHFHEGLLLCKSHGFDNVLFILSEKEEATTRTTIVSWRSLVRFEYLHSVELWLYTFHYFNFTYVVDRSDKSKYDGSIADYFYLNVDVLVGDFLLNESFLCYDRVVWINWTSTFTEKSIIKLLLLVDSVLQIT